MFEFHYFEFYTEPQKSNSNKKIIYIKFCFACQDKSALSD